MHENHALTHNLNYDKITDHIFVGSSICCQTHFEQELLRHGITANISLEEERPDVPPGVDVFLWLPTTNNLPPSNTSMQVGISLLKNLENQNIITYVNCRFGCGRAPTLVAGYFVREKGMTANEAMRLVAEKRPVAHFDKTQINALEELENSTKTFD